MDWDFQEAVLYYKRQGAPNDQSALLSLLREIQQAYDGGIPQSLLPELAESLGTKESFLLALVRRIPSLHIKDHNVLEMCAGPNCGKHTALAAYVDKMTAGRGNVTVRYVPCMRMCGKGPNLRWNGKLYHQADDALIRNLLQSE